MEATVAEKRGMEPLGRYIGMAVAGTEPDEMGIGPVFAVPKLLERFGLKVDDIGLWELNEAFAVQVLYCRDKLGIPNDLLNVDGGAISIGHPYGMMAIATAVRYFFVSWLGERTVADIRLAVHRNLLRLSPGFFEENRPAEITSRITVDTTIIEQVVGTTVSVALRNVVLAFACVGILVYLAPKLAGMMLLGLPVALGPIILLGRRVRSISIRSQDRIADVGAVTSEVLGAMKIVQAFGQQGRETGRFAEAVSRVFATAKKRILLRAVMERKRLPLR